eukprot:NODE_11771_length_200_cov_68.953642_g11156_i0.p2 GENE.NODE_11771_length_200_cov_68.953642_g11156_i0~~NODE_11771_length_200_cov_68.953642_g11156_i0.p2  ORF type:complete len:56 (-),score=26.82 NODE_11771_length_200_cov_68.953642_g11156_i0:5-172(-)
MGAARRRVLCEGERCEWEYMLYLFVVHQQLIFGAQHLMLQGRQRKKKKKKKKTLR